MLQVVLAPDGAQPVDALFADLTAAEQELANSLFPESRRRHFALGRWAAHVAVHRAIAATDDRCGVVEVVPGLHGAPQVRLDGEESPVSVSLAHSGRLAAACAWRKGVNGRLAAGVDLERVRPSKVAESEYAFSARERALLAMLPEGPRVGGLVAWTVKEAVWKALRLDQSYGPWELRIRALDLRIGQAEVGVSRRLLPRLGDAALRVRIVNVMGPDGPYFLTLAEVVSGGVASVREDDWEWSVVWKGENTG